MTQVVSSISGLEIYSPSAGFAPTNSGDVSAIASGYQVVSSTATQLYAGTAFLTGVNGAPVSASRAGQAANASMATSAYYDGTGRLISALPDSAAVSAIASSYAESAVSSKLDTTAFSAVSGDFLTAETVSSIATAQYGPQPTDVGVTTINGFGLVAKSADTAYSAIWASIANTDYNLRELTSLADSAAVSAIASSYAESAVSSKADASALSSYALSSDVSGVIDTVSANSASWAGGGTVSVDSNMSGDGYNTPLGLNPVVKLSAAGSAGYVYIHGGSGSFTVSGNTARFQGTGKNTMNVSFNCDPDKKAALFIGPWVASNNWAGVSAQYTAGNINMYLRASGSGSAGLTLWDSAGSAQMQKSSIPYWDGKLDSSASSSFYTTANESGYVGSAYVDSAVSGKMDTSAMTSYALSADVSGTVDLVSTQSANWGGSALALSAGPGVKLDMVGNTLVASTDRTLLWSGDITTANPIAQLTEPHTSFEMLEFHHSFEGSGVNKPNISYIEAGYANTADTAKIIGVVGPALSLKPWEGNNIFEAYGCFVTNTSATNDDQIRLRGAKVTLDGTVTEAFNHLYHCYAIYGINRTAGV